MFQRLNHRLFHYLLLFAAGAGLFLVNLGGPSLWDIDEGRNMTAALEMRVSGNWIVPTFNGQLRSHKPVLLYWLQVAAFEMFGVNEFAGRLPSALAAVMALLLVYELARRMFNASTGLIAGLVLASSTLFSAAAHFANPDALLLTFTTAALLFFWLGVDTGKPAWILASGIATGLAVLTKGPVGLMLPTAVMMAFLVWSGRWRLLYQRVWVYAFLLCCLVALPWYVLVAIDTKRAFLNEFLLTHNLERALNPMENHDGPPWYYLVVLMIGLVPWSAFLGSALWYGAKEVRRVKSDVRSAKCEVRSAKSEVTWAGGGGMDLTSDFGLRTSHASKYRFLWCWIAVYMVAFTLAATKLPNYVLPIFPAVAVLIASFLDRWRCGELEVPGWLQPLSTAILGLIGVTTIIGLLVVGGAMPVDLLHGRSWPGLEQWAALGAIPLAGAGLGAWCLYRRQRTAFVTVTVIAALGFLAPLAGASAALNAFRAPRPLVEQAGALRCDQEIRVGCYQLEFLPSLNFYVQRNVQHHQNEQDSLDFLRQEHLAFLFLPKREWEQIAPRVSFPHRVLAMHRDMYRAGEVVVISNR